MGAWLLREWICAEGFGCVLVGWGRRRGWTDDAFDQGGGVFLGRILSDILALSCILGFCGLRHLNRVFFFSGCSRRDVVSELVR